MLHKNVKGSNAKNTNQLLKEKMHFDWLTEERISKQVKRLQSGVA